MTDTAQVNLTAMDFAEIKANLKAFLKGQDEFKDYEFEGSGLNILIDLLAYNSQNQAYLANMLANEAEIDSAIIRSNVVSRAKLLGYTPKSNTAARAVLSITVSDPGNSSTSLLLPRGTRFVVKSTDQQFTFVTLQDYNLQINALGDFVNDEVEVFEGSIKTYSFEVTSNERRYVLPSKRIDTATLKVAVFDTVNSNNFTVYNKATGISKINDQSNVYWVYETDGGNFELKFGDGVLGKKPTLNGLVYCEYLDTNGPTANDFSKFSLVGVFEGYENADINIETVNNSAGGAYPEATSSIKLNAPRFYQSQNRAITDEDFAAVTNEIYHYAKSVAVWGGQTLNPPKYGQVFISIIPKSLSKLTSSNKRDIERKIASKAVSGIRPVLIDPKFINLNMTVYTTVQRNSTAGLGNFAHQIDTLVQTYFDNTFGIFDSDFYYSNLLTEIKNYSRAIKGVRAEYTLSLVGSLAQSEFAFENPIVSGTIKSNPIRLIGQSDLSSIYDENGIIFANSVEIGTVDYDKGLVKLNNKLIQQSSNGSIEVFVTPLNDDIRAGFASALVLNKNRLAVELETV